MAIGYIIKHNIVRMSGKYPEGLMMKSFEKNRILEELLQINHY